MPAVPKLGVRRSWFSTTAARATLPSMHSATGAVVFDEESGQTVRVRVAGRVVTITHADAQDDSYRIVLGAIHSRYWTKPLNERKVTIHTDHRFDPTRAVAAGSSADAAGLTHESPLFDDSNSPHAETDAHARTNSSVRALHARLLWLGQTVPGLLARVASAAFDRVGPAEQTALGEAYLQLLQDALSIHGAARRIYAERCAYSMLT